MTTTPASSSHEIINPANVIQPRVFVIPETVADLLTVASACIPSFCVSVAMSSCAAAGSTTAFDGRGDATGPVPMVEDKSPILPLASTTIGAGRAFRFRGRWGRLFFIAYCPFAELHTTGNFEKLGWCKNITSTRFPNRRTRYRREPHAPKTNVNAPLLLGERTRPPSKDALGLWGKDSPRALSFNNRHSPKRKGSRFCGCLCSPIFPR
jgi:hypothetical protein